jgi:periplasmic copper chaperone A
MNSLIRWAGYILFFIIAGCSQGEHNHNAHHEPLMIENGRIRAALPGSDVTAGYFDVTNMTEKLIAVDRVTSDLFESVEMHQTVFNGDKVSMKRIPSLEISSGKTISFEPSGLHLMLRVLKRPLNEGEKVIVKFYSSTNNKTYRGEFVVTSQTGSNQSSHIH